MEVRFSPEEEAQIIAWAASIGKTPTELIEQIMTVYLKRERQAAALDSFIRPHNPTR
jgi:hypothetical protein